MTDTYSLSFCSVFPLQDRCRDKKLFIFVIYVVLCRSIEHYWGPIVLTGFDFEIIPVEVVRGQVFLGMGVGVRGRGTLLGEGIRDQFS